MKSQILIALIASLQIAAPAFALDQSEWITPDNSVDITNQIDIVGTPAAATTSAAAATPSVPMQSGWITQDAPAASSQSASAAQSGTGQSGWVKPTLSGQTEISCPATVTPAMASESNQPQMQGSVTRSQYSPSGGSGVAGAVATGIARAAGGAAAAAMMIGASRMMYGGMNRGYGGFRGYAGGGYGRGYGYNPMNMMGGYMMQRAAFNMLRGF